MLFTKNNGEGKKGIKMKKTEENEKVEKQNKNNKNPETLAAVHTHTHKCFKE